MWKRIGKACEWKYLRAPCVRKMFDESHRGVVVLYFLRDTRVGCTISLAPLTVAEGEEEEGEVSEGEVGGPGAP